MHIGVFDSGIGGQAVAGDIQTAFPEAHITVIDDREHVPYGNRTEADILHLTEQAIQPLLVPSIDYIVVACNTATAIAIESLRQKYPTNTFIGLEPMIKPASLLTESGTVTICATPATLASKRYKQLKARYGDGVTFYEPDCSTWALLIENNTINQAIVSETLTSHLYEASDVIVLACTHYHWIRSLIELHAGSTKRVIDPSLAIIRRIQQLASTPVSER